MYVRKKGIRLFLVSLELFYSSLLRIVLKLYIDRMIVVLLAGNMKGSLRVINSIFNFE